MKDSIDLCKGSSPLSPSDRSRIISRIHSLLNWVGELLPQQIEIEGRSIDLRDVVYDYLIKDDHTPGEKQQALALADMLLTEETRLEGEIRTEDLDRQHACEICHEARMLLRAVDELRVAPCEEVEVRKLGLLKKVEDAKRWDKFVKRLK